MISITTLARAAGVAVASGAAILASTLPADAATFTGKVTGNNGISVRSGPSTHLGSVGSYGKGAKINLECKVRGTKVSGNNIWYALAGRTGWVSARYVANVGKAPGWCPASYPSGVEGGVGEAKTGLNVRSGPTTKDSKVGSLRKGYDFGIICSAMGQSVNGNATWYQIERGKWVAAAYAMNTSGYIAPCDKK